MNSNQHTVNTNKKVFCMLITVHYKFVSFKSFITLMMAVVTAETCQFSNLIKVSSFLLNQLYTYYYHVLTKIDLNCEFGLTIFS